MGGSLSEVLFLFVLMALCLGLSISQKSLYFLNGDFALGGKILELQTSGILSCAVSCFQTDNCSFFSHNIDVCSGYSKENGSFVTESNEVFRVYQKQDKLIQNNYRAHGSSGKYVKQHNDEKTWDDALQTCQAEGATLVKLDNQKIASLYDEMFYDKDHNDNLWIGLSDKYNNDTWYWTDGSPVGSTFWNAGQPDNERDGLKENCVFTHFYSYIHVQFGVRWSDTACNNTRKFVCERMNET